MSNAALGMHSAGDSGRTYTPLTVHIEGHCLAAGSYLDLFSSVILYTRNRRDFVPIAKLVPELRAVYP